MFSRSSKLIIGGCRPSFTLVELLVSIAIIGVMAGMVLFTLAGAQEDALRSRTRATITKINSVILERWEGYRYRAVKSPVPAQWIKRNLITSREVARLRSVFIKDMMRMELPDRESDLTYTPTNLSVNTVGGPQNLVNAPGREYDILRNNFNLADVPGSFTPAVPNVAQLNTGRSNWLIDPNDSNAPPKNQSAECLYAIVAQSTTGGGSALEGFHASEIGDTDGDGYPEFIDAWGNPICWIRWPAGYNSVLNNSYRLSSPDAFDPLRTSVYFNNPPPNQPWTLVPLIVSAGADDDFGIDDFQLSDSVVVSPVYPAFATSRDAFFPMPDAPRAGLISSLEAATDNVSSHDILLE